MIHVTSNAAVLQVLHLTWCWSVLELLPVAVAVIGQGRLLGALAVDSRPVICNNKHPLYECVD